MVWDLNIFSQKWSEITRRKKFFTHFFPLCSINLNVFLPPLPAVQCPNFLDFPNPWGKFMERNGLIFQYICSKRLKNCRVKKVWFSTNFAFLAGFFWYRSTICIGQEMLCLLYAGFFSYKFEFAYLIISNSYYSVGKLLKAC